MECIKAVLWESALLFPASFSLLCEGLEPLGRQDIEHHLVADDLLDLSADVDALAAEHLLALLSLDLDDAPLDDMGGATVDQAVDHAGSAHQSDLPDGQGQQGALIRPVQAAPGVHQPADAVRLRELPLQFSLIEPLPLEDLHLLVHGGDGIAPLFQLRNTLQCGGVGVPLQRYAGIWVVGPFFTKA